MQVNLLTLHREPDRRAYFAAETRPIFYDEGLRCFVVADSALAGRLLQHECLGTVGYAAAYESLERQSGQVFPNLLYAFRNIPICLDDAAHREARRHSAAVLAATRSAMAAALPNLIAVHFSLLREADELDLIGDVLLPLVDDVMAVLLGTEADALDQFRGVPGIFDRMIGLRRRMELDAEVGVARTLFAGRGDDAVAYFTLVALGHDALLGTVGESLRHVLAENPGTPLRAISYPEAPVETGVPYVERVAKRAFLIDEHSFKEGDRVRILMQAFAYSGSVSDRSRIFGVGPHACLGRQLTLDLWAGIVAYLKQIDRRPEIVSHEMRPGDFVWTCPSEILVRMHDDDV